MHNGVQFEAMANQLCCSALNKFSYSRPYNKSNIPGSTEFRDIWVQKTYVTSGESFPTVLRRSEIMNVEVQDISPIENALNDIEQKTKELTILETKYSALAKAGETQFSTNALSMSLNGAVDAPVNGGITLYRQAFMHADFIARHPTQEGMVQKLRDAIDEQVSRFIHPPRNLLTKRVRRSE